jgi:hypothetical protein
VSGLRSGEDVDTQQPVATKRFNVTKPRLFLALSLAVLGVSYVRNLPSGDAIGPPTPPVFYISCAQFDLPTDTEVNTNLNFEAKTMEFDWLGVANTEFRATVSYLSTECLGDPGVRSRARQSLVDFVFNLDRECTWLRSEMIRYDQTGVGIKHGDDPVNRQAVTPYVDQWCSSDHGGLDLQIAQLS